MSRRLRQLVVTLALATLFLAAGPLSFANPPGNNGTVKVDGVPFDDAPNNEPHPGCSFQIDFYGYEAGNLAATLAFEGIPPTGGGTLATDSIFIGQDAAGGGTDLDASRTYDLTAALSNVQSHARQGYHVKLTVHADGSIGSDVKHKVFWVAACSPPGDHPHDPAPPPAKPAGAVPGNPVFTG